MERSDLPRGRPLSAPGKKAVPPPRMAGAVLSSSSVEIGRALVDADELLVMTVHLQPEQLLPPRPSSTTSSLTRLSIYSPCGGCRLGRSALLRGIRARRSR